VECDEGDCLAGERVDGEDDASEGEAAEGPAPARAAAPVAGVVPLVAGDAADGPDAGPQAATARAGMQASTTTAAGRARRAVRAIRRPRPGGSARLGGRASGGPDGMGRDVSKPRIPEGHL
jgi:hypothetical protein